LQNKITDERRHRENAEEELVTRLNEMIESIRSEIEYERQTRLKAEESLLSLLEDSMHRLK
jgi:argonaute-like protein implicated in RNA metabolism and viral defense